MSSAQNHAARCTFPDFGHWFKIWADVGSGEEHNGHFGSVWNFQWWRFSGVGRQSVPALRM